MIEGIKTISQLSTIKCFEGRIYKIEADEQSYLEWHNDLENKSDGRLLGVSINLSPEIYQGGTFKIRNRATQQVHGTIKHDAWGSGHFFRIDAILEHSVERVSGDFPRIAYAGWFKDKIDNKIAHLLNKE